jgi:hypothetical protein
MRLAVAAATTALIGGLLYGVAEADSGPAYFPSPPPDVTYFTATGILTDYYVGMKSGQLTIKLSNGHSVSFYRANTMTINGAPVHCQAPPANGQTPPPGICSDWPANIVIGTTRVTVTYWKAVTYWQAAPSSATNPLVVNQITGPTP